MIEQVDLLEGLFKQLRNRVELAALLALTDPGHDLLAAVDRVLDVALGLIADLRDNGTGVNQRP